MERPPELSRREGRNRSFDEGALSVYRSVADYSASGAVGAPQLATAGKGEHIFESLGDELESLPREIYEKNC